MPQSKPNRALKAEPAPEIRYRVIAGVLKGKEIVVPDLKVTRPPLTRVRRAIADFLMPYLPDARVLDLFSGTGSYLFELISRGATSVTGVEKERALAEAINLQARQLGVAERLTCLRDDVFFALPKLGEKKLQFDVVMIAPPQYKGIMSQTLAIALQAKIAGEGSLWLLQHDPDEKDEISLSGFRLLQERHYGNTMFTIVTPE